MAKCQMSPCDAEVGSVKNGWHRCGRKAVLVVHRIISEWGYHLNYCEKHQRRQEERPKCVTHQSVEAI